LQGLVAGAPQSRACCNLDRPGQMTSNPAGWRVPGAEGAAQAVQDATIDFMDNGGRETAVGQRPIVFSEAIGDHGGAPSISSSAILPHPPWREDRDSVKMPPASAYPMQMTCEGEPDAIPVRDRCHCGAHCDGHLEQPAGESPQPDGSQ